jgi:predicted acetyltransferase
MISFGKDKYKPVLKEMWKLCFPEDTDTFINFYFDEVYKNDETLIYLVNRKPVATFQMTPYFLKTGEEIFCAGYISGAMTHPDFRQRRFMRELLLMSFNIMQERGFDYTFLIPQEKWLFDYYGKFGYKIIEGIYKDTAYHCKGETRNNSIDYTSIPDCFTISQFATMDITTIYHIYYRFLSEIPQVILKTEEQFKQILRNFLDENGVLFASEQGIAFTFKKENYVVVKEFFYQNKKIRDLFLKTICNCHSQEKIVIQNSSDKLNGKQGMIKRLNGDTPEILTLYISMMLD